MPYNFAAESFHTKKLCSRLSSRKVQFSVREPKKLSSLRPPLGGLGATYDVHLRLIGKLVGDFLLVIIELFSLGAFVLSQYTRLTDGQTDGQTDRISTAIPCVYASQPFHGSQCTGLFHGKCNTTKGSQREVSFMLTGLTSDDCQYATNCWVLEHDMTAWQLFGSIDLLLLVGWRHWELTSLALFAHVTPSIADSQTTSAQHSHVTCATMLKRVHSCMCYRHFQGRRNYLCCVLDLAFYIDFDRLCHWCTYAVCLSHLWSRRKRVHIEMLSASYNIAMLDACFLCRQLSFLLQCCSWAGAMSNPSICPSIKRMNYDKTKETSAHSLIPYARSMRII